MAQSRRSPMPGGGDESPVSFEFAFLGKADSLSPNATGFASLQRPLLSVYFLHIQRSASPANPGAPAASLCLSWDGLLVRCGAEEEFYAYADVAYTDYVRFEIIRDAQRRHLGHFLRQSAADSAEPAGDVLVLDPALPQHARVLGFPHRPMLASVLRRTRGVRRLECHLFAADSELGAVAFVQELHHAQARQRRREAHRLFQYTPRWREETEDAESFRTAMRQLSKSQTLRRSPAAGANCPGDDAEGAPLPKPRQGRLQGRGRSSEAVEGPSGRRRTRGVARAKSLSHLPRRARSTEGEEAEEDDTAAGWRPDGSSDVVTRLISRFEERGHATVRPVARVRPTVVQRGEEAATVGRPKASQWSLEAQSGERAAGQERRRLRGSASQDNFRRAP